ncbi:uncharacterized protein B0T15DRAFT_531251 [Chaetomium strumarium]|uniref:Uncharacterized protein n=1 Tax=Chaetomium strumarium TaxID=1170767 RepID=A0AAJ0M122_9PEZI|nr:hypothetical protein B0T15DRAFT_531251 [Chaetomium strumarium]
MTGLPTGAAGYTNILTPVRSAIITTDDDRIERPVAPMGTSRRGSTRTLTALPLEILQNIIQLLIPTNQVLTVRYPYPKPWKGPRTYGAKSLMLSCRTNYHATIPILYGWNTFCFDQDPYNSLPLFLQNLQESTFLSLRRVQIRCSDTDNLIHGLDLLVGCVSLESLEIVTFRWPIAKYHKSVLECFRLKSFRVGHIEHKRGEWLQGLPDLIMSDMNRTTNQRQRVEMSRQAKLEKWGLHFYKLRNGEKPMLAPPRKRRRRY